MKNSEQNAFPQETNYYHHGLTKREYFAGLAMQGLLSSGRRYTDKYQEIAVAAVKQADELLKQLEK